MSFWKTRKNRKGPNRVTKQVGWPQPCIHRPETAAASFRTSGVIGIFHWHAPHERPRLVLRLPWRFCEILDAFASVRPVAWLHELSHKSSAEAREVTQRVVAAKLIGLTEYSDNNAPRGRKRYYLLSWRDTPWYKEEHYNSDVVRKGCDNRTS